MKRRNFSLVLGLAMALFLMVGNHGRAAEETKLKLRLQTHLIPTQTQRSMGSFAPDVAAASKGSMEISVFPVGAVVPFKEVMNAVGSGTLDMALYPEGAWFKTVPVSEVAMGIPFALKDLEESKTFMTKKGLIELLREGYAKHNVHIIPYETFPVGLMTKKPVTTVGDLKGMKLRAYGTMGDFLGKLGASTTLIPGGELYTALATGVVSGAHWGDAGPMYEMKFHEVLKNYMDPEPIQGSWNMIMINLDLWKKMSPGQKSILETEARKAGDASFNSARALTKTALEDMSKNWQVQIIKLSEADLNVMRKASAELQEEISKKDPLCAKAISKLKEMTGKK